MAVTLDIKNMSFEDKIMTMEALWEDLSKQVTPQELPAWHDQVLAQRQAEVAKGEGIYSDWEMVKSRLDKL